MANNAETIIAEGRVHLPATRFSSGVLAGLMACAVTQPFDITKTHVQLYPQRYRSMLCVIGHLYSVICTPMFISMNNNVE